MFELTQHNTVSGLKLIVSLLEVCVRCTQCMVGGRDVMRTRPTEIELGQQLIIIKCQLINHSIQVVCCRVYSMTYWVHKSCKVIGCIEFSSWIVTKYL